MVLFLLKNTFYHQKTAIVHSNIFIMYQYVHFIAPWNCAKPKYRSKEVVMECGKMSQIWLKAFDALMRWCFQMHQYCSVLQKCYGITFLHLHMKENVKMTCCVWTEETEYVLQAIDEKNITTILDSRRKCSCIATYFVPPSSSSWAPFGWDFRRNTANVLHTVQWEHLQISVEPCQKC